MHNLMSTYLEESQVKRLSTKDIEDTVIQSLGIDKYWEIGGYRVFAEIITSFVDKGILRPIKTRRMNGMNPPLYNGYQIIMETKTLCPSKSRKLLTEYHPSLDLAYFLNNPDEYRIAKPYLQILNKFLFLEEHGPSITVNERSFQIFNDEKWLLSKEGDSLLKKIGLTLSDLNCHPTYEPFFYYQRPDFPPMASKILIVENKDTFFSLKSLMQQGITTWATCDYNFLIYGEGRKITRSLSFLKEVLAHNFTSRQIVCHYFGDLDPEGINIWADLKNTYASWHFSIELATYFYRELFLLYKEQAPYLINDQKWSNDAITGFLMNFEHTLAEEMKQVLSKNRYIPQEGLNLEILRTLAKG